MMHFRSHAETIIQPSCRWAVSLCMAVRPAASSDFKVLQYSSLNLNRILIEPQQSPNWTVTLVEAGAFSNPFLVQPEALPFNDVVQVLATFLI